jgi:hypothetical protein
MQIRLICTTRNVGLAGTGDRTRATCEAGSGNHCSNIHFDFKNTYQIGFHLHMITRYDTELIQFTHTKSALTYDLHSSLNHSIEYL